MHKGDFLDFFFYFFIFFAPRTVLFLALKSKQAKKQKAKICCDCEDFFHIWRVQLGWEWAGGALTCVGHPRHLGEP